jgi:tRNA 2-thiocytidine biosynthesis protein TtcA
VKLQRELIARVDKAIWEYRMISPGDRLLFAVSGGADSMLLAHLLPSRLSFLSKDIRTCAVYIDLGFSDAADERCLVMETFFRERQMEHRIIRTTIGPLAHSEANLENPCFLCSRIRRKHIFATAEAMGCNKIVFGHHKDDLVETLLINMVFGREISTSPPVLKIKRGKFHILRPLVFAEETAIKELSHQLKLPAFSQQCPSDGHSKRQYMKELVSRLNKDFPGARENLFWSMKKIKKGYLL